jgi:hypothetical protein
MSNSTSSNKLNRFTTLPFTIDLLKTKKLVLLNPNTWPDHNDVDILLNYKDKKKITSILALCFTDGSETIHHWTAFSNTESGVCIEFDKKKLLNHLASDKHIRHQKVKYPIISKTSNVLVDDIPFKKRYPYECEREYRIIAELDEEKQVYQVDISLNAIVKITLSPKLPASTALSITEVLKTLIGDTPIIINHSSLFNNEEWIAGFKRRMTV